MKKAILIIILVIGLIIWNRSSGPPAVGTQMGDAIPAQLMDSNGGNVSSESLKGKYIGLYFSAHWCPPCQVFTPELVKFRDANVNNNFEVVFISADFSEQEKQTYIRETGMKWLHVPGAAGPVHRELEKRFGISGYPTLVILAPDGRVVTHSGVNEIMIAPGIALKRWKATKS